MCEVGGCVCEVGGGEVGGCVCEVGGCVCVRCVCDQPIRLV